MFAAANPYADTLETLARARTSLQERHADALLLDCIGFTEQHRRALVDATGLPVILSNALMAKSSGRVALLIGYVSAAFHLGHGAAAVRAAHSVHLRKLGRDPRESRRVRPPSITIARPVTKSNSGMHNRPIMRAISSSVTNLPSGVAWIAAAL
jgi:AroM protein